jgi:hypothetical protein
VVLTPRRRRQVSRRSVGPTGRGQAIHSRGDGDKKARSPGRARNKPLKPLRAGMPGDSGGLVVTTLVWLFFSTRGCGCIGHPAFPTPSSGGSFVHHPGASCRGNAKLRLSQSAVTSSFETRRKNAAPRDEVCLLRLEAQTLVVRRRVPGSALALSGAPSRTMRPRMPSAV